MAAQDEILRIRMEQDIEREARKAAAAAARLDAEIKELQAGFARGAVHGEHYRRELAALTRQYDQVTRAAERAAQAQQAAASRRGGQLTASQRGMIGWQTAQMVQDAVQGGNPAFALNNLMFMAQMQGGIGNLTRAYVQMGREAPAALGKLAAAHPLATAAIAATGAALVVLDRDLKQSGLSWSDFTTVVENTKPFRAAEEAARGLGEAVTSSGLAGAVSAATGGVAGMVDELANIALGWDDAKEAAKAHNEQAERAAKWTAEAAEAAEKLARVKSPEQQAAAESGKLFAEILSGMGGANGIEGILGQLATGEGDRRAEDMTRLNALAGRAMAGDTHAADQIADLVEGRGMDARGLRGAFGPKFTGEVMGPGRDVLGLYSNQPVAEQPGDAMVAEFRKLQEKWAADAAPAFAGEPMGPGRDVLDRAIEDARADRADQFAAARLQLGLAEMGGGPKAPSVIAAESFAAQLQASGAAKPTELMREQLDRLEALEKLAETTNRILERRGLLGP